MKVFYDCQQYDYWTTTVNGIRKHKQFIHEGVLWLDSMIIEPQLWMVYKNINSLYIEEF